MDSEMDGDFLDALREAPQPAFASSLRAGLRAIDAAQSRRRAARRRLRALGLSAGVLLMAGSLAFPAVRAMARQILDLFRDRSVVDVRFDPARLAPVREMLAGRSPALLIFGELTLVQDPGPPATFPTLAAAAAAGHPIAAPASLPPGVEVERVEVTGPGLARLSVDRGRLHAVIDRLDLREVRVPRGLGEASFELPLTEAVAVHYRSRQSAAGHAVYVERERPGPALPRGLDLPLLGEIGLRVAGVEARQAQALAAEIDWPATFLVPFPLGEASFRSVDVGGHPGLAVSGGEAGLLREHTVMWTADGRLHALTGDLPLADLLQMAGSVR